MFIRENDPSAINNHDVYLTSYMRPEMTRASIEKVLEWERLGNFTIVIDGLRSSADEAEKQWREETIRIAEEKCSENSNMNLWVYKDNIGITNHTIRIQGRALDSGNSGIWLEEDIDLDLTAYSEILDQLDYGFSVEPILISAFSHFNHPSDSNQLIKGNFFLPIWGMVFNESFYELFCKVWNDRKFEDRVVRNTLGGFFSQNSLIDKAHRSKVLDYWTEYSRWGFSNQNRWDAVANYALWTSSTNSFSTLNRLAQDLSYVDTRGMNQRSAPASIESHEFRSKHLNQSEFCIDCEVKGSRIDRNLFKRAHASLKYRLRHKL
jgi:hypothetical protein